MDGLLEELDTCRNAATQVLPNSSEAQELIDQLVEAGSKVLNYRASLSPHVAHRVLSDDRARRIRDEALHAAEQCNTLATPVIYALEQSRKSAATVLDRMRQSNVSSDQLNRAASSVTDRYEACMRWWGKKALRSERMQFVCAATSNLPSTTPEMRQTEEAALRLHTGSTLYMKCLHLQSQIALAQVKIEPQAKYAQASHERNSHGRRRSRAAALNLHSGCFSGIQLGGRRRSKRQRTRTRCRALRRPGRSDGAAFGICVGVTRHRCQAKRRWNRCLPPHWNC